MDKNEFEVKLEKAFHSGGIFKEWYFEALNNNETLQTLAIKIKEEVAYKMKLLGALVEKNKARYDLIKLNIKTDQDCYLFFRYYLAKNSVCAHPELCGRIVGAMAKKMMFDNAVELIGLNEIDEDEELYWDS